MLTDLLRVVVAVPVFTYGSVYDLRERRVPHQTWLPLVAVGVVALVADLSTAAGTPAFTPMVLTASVSIAVGLFFGYGFYYLGTVGGADRYALAVLGISFPLYPHFRIFGTGLPVIEPNLQIFILSILGNTVLIGLFYPLALFARNILRGDVSVMMFVAEKVDVSELHEGYGRVIAGPEELSPSLGIFQATGGVWDREFASDYVEWSGLNDVTEITSENLDLKGFIEDTYWRSDDVASDREEFLDLSSADEVWVSPGIPFVVPVFLGLLTALTAGDLLFGVLNLVFPGFY
ncbi:MAG: prepilin peptidase [Halobacteria archaeon]